MGTLLSVPALGANGPYRARRRTVLADVCGEAVAELSLVPDLFVIRTMAALHKSTTMPAEDRSAALIRAAELFATASLGGMTISEHHHAVSRLSGLPISVVRAATQTIAARLCLAHDSSCRGRPTGAVVDWRDPATRKGGAVWTRRGDVLAVLAAGNHPGAQSIWPEALALGYRVAVRPSQREPLTPHRLVTALREAGFGDDHVALLPTDHRIANCMLDAADLAMAYGGIDVAGAYGGRRTMLLQGPGRSKIVVTSEVDWRDHLGTIAESVAHHAGAGCVNTTAVLVEGSPAALAEALAERLSYLPSLPPDDEKAVLPVFPAAEARAIEQQVMRRAAGARGWLGADGIVDELVDGSAVLRPAVHEVDRPDSPQISAEFPFPCVWVAPWDQRAGVALLRNTLVLTAMTRDERLVDDLMQEPTIGNVYVGDHRTYEMAHGMPHDGYLADFLMRTKGVIRD